MTAHLHQLGYQVNGKRVGRLMPIRRTSKPQPGHKVYPYILRGVDITHCDQVWSSDITYVPMPHGLIYLVAVMDWYSRYVISWELSNTLDTAFCLQALELALSSGQPEIFNPPTRSRSVWKMQGLPSAWTGVVGCLTVSLLNAFGGVSSTKISILWRMKRVPELFEGLEPYFQLYNHRRPHRSLGNRTPAQVYAHPKTDWKAS